MLWLLDCRAQSNTRNGTHINFPMKNITLRSLMTIHGNLSKAVSEKKSYTMRNPEEFILIIEEFTKIKQECDSLKSEQEKLLRVLASLQHMAESVQKIIQE